MKYNMHLILQEKIMRMFGAVVAALAVLFLTGCPNGNGGGTYTVSGTVTFEVTTSSGTDEVLIVAMETNPAEIAAAAAAGDLTVLDYYLAITVPNGSDTADYEFTSVEEGTYHVVAVMDVDGNGDFFDLGDYAGCYPDDSVDPTSDPPQLAVSSDMTGVDFVTYLDEP
jgi:hypothetical protein